MGMLRVILSYLTPGHCRQSSPHTIPMCTNSTVPSGQRHQFPNNVAGTSVAGVCYLGVSACRTNPPEASSPRSTTSTNMCTVISDQPVTSFNSASERSLCSATRSSTAPRARGRVASWSSADGPQGQFTDTDNRKRELANTCASVTKKQRAGDAGPETSIEHQ